MTAFVGRVFRAFILITLAVSLLAAERAHAAPFAGIVMDARSGEVLWEKNSETRLHPASLTKMMTLYIAFQEIEAGRLSLDSEVTVTQNAAAQPPSKLGLKRGQKIKMRYLIRAAAVKSANDAATAIGEHISGSEAAFAKRMTRTAKAIGMRNTTFRNANGLTSEGHLSTARDMNVLGRHMFYDFPQYYNIFSRRTADAGMAQVRNTNSRFLDGYEGADGIKTGYTVAAGFNLTASAKRGDVRIISTVFGGDSTVQRNAKMVELMNIGFSKARKRVNEKRPNAPGIMAGDELIASSEDSIGGSGKTIRVSGSMTSSLRPKSRPASLAAPMMLAEATTLVPDALSDAISQGVEAALAEATATAKVTAPVTGPIEVAVEARVDEPATIAVATNAPAPPADSFQAQVAQLQQLDAPAAILVAEANSLEAQAQALVAAVSGLRPQSRPENLGAPVETAAAQQVELAAAETEDASKAAVLEKVPAAEPEIPFQVVSAPQEAPVLPEVKVASAEVAALDEPLDEMPSVVSEAPAGLGQIQMTSAPAEIFEEVAPTRRAPIFDRVEVASAEAAEAEPTDERVVVAKSTSGGRAWSVNIGSYNSRYEAEKGMLKTALAESATLNQGLRNVTSKGGKYRASFMGLSEDQAAIACRRMKARGQACEIIGPG